MTRYARNSLPSMFGLLLASAPAPFVGGDGYYAGGFGNYASGRTLLDFGEPDPQSADANAMAMLPDGSFVIAGSRTGGTSFFHMAAAHVGATGTHDLAFGSGGVVTFDPPGSYLSSANAVVHQSSGKTILVGTANYGTLGNSNGDFSACRLTLSGTLDPTYGIDGCSRQGFDARRNQRLRRSARCGDRWLRSRDHRGFGHERSGRRRAFQVRHSSTRRRRRPGHEFRRQRPHADPALRRDCGRSDHRTRAVDRDRSGWAHRDRRHEPTLRFFGSRISRLRNSTPTGISTRLSAMPASCRSCRCPYRSSTHDRSRSRATATSSSAAIRNTARIRCTWPRSG